MLKLLFGYSEKFKLDKRLINIQQMIIYERNKKATSPKTVQENVHFVRFFQSEKTFFLKNMPNYFIIMNKNDRSIKIQNRNLNVDKELNFIKMKID
jgi:hypothetical protein